MGDEIMVDFDARSGIVKYYTRQNGESEFTPAGTAFTNVTMDNVGGNRRFRPAASVQCIGTCTLEFVEMSNGGRVNIPPEIAASSIDTTAFQVTIEADSIAYSDDLDTGTSDDELTKIKLTSLPSTGTLYLDANGNEQPDAGEAVNIDDEIDRASLDAKQLLWQPPNGQKNVSDMFKFKGSDGVFYSEEATMTLKATIPNFPPVASNINISGTVEIGSTLSATYDYSDEEGDLENGTTFQWYRADDDQGSNKSSIAGATSQTYTLTGSDIDKYIRFEVTPNDGNSAGNAAQSDWQGPVKQVENPKIVNTTPENGANGVDQNATITITFEKNIDAASLNTDHFLVWGGQNGLYDGSFSGGGTKTVTFDPNSSFFPGEVITVRTTTGIKTASGVSVEPYIFQFEAATNTYGFKPDLFKKTDLVTGSGVRGTDIAATDIDGDHDIDLLYASSNSLDGDGTGEMLWLENDGSGSFTRHKFPNASENTQFVTGADLDQDGYMDVIYVDESNISWYQNDGHQNFTSRQLIPSSPNTIQVRDVDGDGDQDLLAANYNDNAIRWYENNGSQSFTSHDISTSARSANDVYGADVDNDGDMDIVSASRGDDTIAWFENDGQQQFTRHNLTTSARWAKSVDVSDINGDGYPDILAASWGDNTISLFLNDGDGSFTKKDLTTSFGQPFDVIARDIDADGDQDILAAGRSANTIRWFKNDGSETFTPVDITTNFSGVTVIKIADLTGAGKLEVAALNSGGTMRSYRFSQKAPNIALAGNGSPIGNGTTETSTSNHTAFGDVQRTGDSQVYTFTIKNEGSLALDLTGSPLISISGANADDFTVSSQPSSSTVSAGGDVTFGITFDPSALGGREAKVSIANSDTDADPHTFAISGTGVNTTPVFTTDASVNADENATTVLDIQANDGDGGAADAGITYSLTGGSDQGAFNIDEQTGTLSFKSAPDFEHPTDSDNNGEYQVQVKADDDGAVNNTVTQSITVTVKNVDEKPVFTSSIKAEVEENKESAFLNVNANDGDGGAEDANITYKLTGGADRDQFAIDASGGALSFANAPDFEHPADADANNEYTVQVTADDGNHTASQTIIVTVTNVNEFVPVITSNGGDDTGSISLDENQTEVTTVKATDQDLGASQSYSLNGGFDAGLFSIDTHTGKLTFKTAPDAENANDSNKDNIYEVIIQVSDGTHTDEQDLSININDVNESAPSITSANHVTIDEQPAAGTDVIQVTADDPDISDTPQFAIKTNTNSNGNDEPGFYIDPVTGEITVGDPQDLDREQFDKIVITVTASDGSKSVDQDLTVKLNDVNEFDPVVKQGQRFSIAEDASKGDVVGTLQGSDQDATAPLQNWTITGGNEDGIFAIDAGSGQITIADPANLDYESKTSYDLSVTVSDGANTSTAEMVPIDITDANDNAPVFSSAESKNMEENQKKVLAVTTTDADQHSTVSYRLSGGADRALFSIDGSSGALAFQTAPDFEQPADANADNTYEVTVTADDGQNTTDQTINVTVRDVNDGSPAITSKHAITIDEQQPAGSKVIEVQAKDPDAGDVLSYSITDNSDGNSNGKGAFAIDASTGQVTVQDAGDLDRELLQKVSFTVQVSDGTHTTLQTITVKLNDVNEFDPVVVADQSLPINEDASNGDIVGTLQGSDKDATATLQDWQITSGNEDGIFTIDASSGVLSIADRSKLDYELVTSYDLEVTVGDGANTSTAEMVSINVTDANDNAPVFTSKQQITVDENTTSVLAVTTTDADQHSTVTYRLSGGADQSLFSLDGSSGALAFQTAPDFEHPADANADNTYEVTVTADDGQNMTDQTINVTVRDVNDGSPTITSNEDITIDEQQPVGSKVMDVEASDPDKNDVLTYVINDNPNRDGDSMGAFNIDQKTGQVTVQDAGDLDRELLQKVSFTVEVSDGTHMAAQQITVSLVDVNEFAPVIGENQSFSVDENAANHTQVGTVQASDKDATSELQNWTITSGNEAGAFDIDPTGGTISVADHSKLDYETTPRFVLGVTVGDGSKTSDPADVIITLNNLNDTAPVINSNTSVTVPENTTEPVLDVEANNGDGGGTDEKITYSITGGDDAARFEIDGGSGVLNLRAAPDYEHPSDKNGDNTYQVILKVDDGGHFVLQPVKVSVRDVNEAPQITGVPDTTIKEDQSYSFSPQASDPEGDDLQFTIANNPDWVSFDEATGKLSGRPSNSDVGTARNIVISVSDGHGHVTPLKAFDLTVQAVNDPPAISAIADQQIDEDHPLGPVPVTLSDPDNPEQQLTLEAASSNPSLVPDENITLGGSGAKRTLQLQPAANQNGATTLNLVTSDGQLTDTTRFTVTVRAVNDNPVISGTPQREVDEKAFYRFTPKARDIEGDPLSFAIKHQPSWMTFDAQTGRLSGTPGNADVGTYRSITISVSDGHGGADTLAAFAIKVHAINDAPVISVDASYRPTYEIAEDDTTSAGVPLKSLLVDKGGKSLLSDVDSKKLGVAIRRVDTTAGVWEYKPVDAKWSLLTSASDTTALLLDRQTRIRFVPAPDYYGEIKTGLSLRAWDHSRGEAEDTLNAKVNGGSTPFSKETIAIKRVVTPVNDQPTVDTMATPALMQVNADPEPISITGLSSGAANEDQTLSFSVRTDNDDLITNIKINHKASASEATLNYDLLPDKFGKAVLTLKVNDELGASKFQTVTIHVGEPMTWRGDLQGLNLSTDDSTRHIPLKDNFKGGTAPFVYNWTNSNPSVLQVDLRADTLDVTPLQAGVSELQFSFEDKAGYLLADTIQVTVEKPLAVGGGPGLPQEFALYQNYPNPFNPTTTIRYDVPKAARVRIHIYNLLGRRVATLVDKQQAAGRYAVKFDGTQLTSGMYLYRIRAGAFVKVKKLTLVK